MNRTYSPAQIRYLEAQALYDVCNTAINVTLGPCPDDENLIAAYVDREMELREELGMREIETALRAAEKDLLTWGRAKIQKLAEYRTNRADLDRLLNNPPIYMRSRLVELTMKLAA